MQRLYPDKIASMTRDTIRQPIETNASESDRLNEEVIASASAKMLIAMQ
jgi:hypothetical protein